MSRFSGRATPFFIERFRSTRIQRETTYIFQNRLVSQGARNVSTPALSDGRCGALTVSGATIARISASLIKNVPLLMVGGPFVLVLEYATERAGEVLPLDGKALGLGVVNPRTETVESSDDICRAVERALQVCRREDLFLNPDCDFGTSSGRPMNSTSIAIAKLESIVQAARIPRG